MTLPQPYQITGTFSRDNKTFTYIMDFGETADSDVKLSMKTDRSADIITFDARTLLPKSQRYITTDDGGKEDTVKEMTVKIEEMRVPGREPYMRHTITRNDLRPETVGNHIGHLKTEYGKTQANAYKMMEEALAQLPANARTQEIRRRFNSVACEIGFSDYATQGMQLGGS